MAISGATRSTERLCFNSPYTGTFSPTTHVNANNAGGLVGPVGFERGGNGDISTRKGCAHSTFQSNPDDEGRDIYVHMACWYGMVAFTWACSQMYWIVQ